MRGIKVEDLLAVVDFMYYGETNIYQDNLDNFMHIAEEFKLKGLQRESNNDKENAQETPEKRHTDEFERRKLFKIKEENLRNIEIATISTNSFDKEDGLSKKIVAISNQIFSGNFQELDYQIKSIMKLGQMNGKKSYYFCKVCGKEGVYGHIKNHIEANHIEGVSIPCTLCEKIFRSRPALKNHNLTHHNMKLVN